MALYDIRVASAAIGVPEAWLSSMLTRIPITGVDRGRQGRRRTLTLDAVLCASIAWTLIEGGGTTVESAVALAHRLLASAHGVIVLGRGLVTISADLAALRTRVHMGLSGAVEQSIEVKRGRPPRRLRREVAGAAKSSGTGGLTAGLEDTGQRLE